MFLTILLVFALSTNSLTEGTTDTLFVNNGGRWGAWDYTDMCPSGSYAGGFSIRVEGRQGRGDDTAVNGIKLYCLKLGGVNAGSVTSNDGHWGDWQPEYWCPGSGKLVAFQLNVEPSQGRGDDTAANDINFRCEDGSVVLGRSGLTWGRWGDWSNECTTGICGITTKVESKQRKRDDTALNDVKFHCCTSNPDSTAT